MLTKYQLSTYSSEKSPVNLKDCNLILLTRASKKELRQVCRTFDLDPLTFDYCSSPEEVSRYHPLISNALPEGHILVVYDFITEPEKIENQLTPAIMIFNQDTLIVCTDNDETCQRQLAETQFIMNRAITYKICPTYRKLMDFSRFYQEVCKDVATHKNRLHRSLQLVFPEIEHVLSNTNNELYWSVVSQFSQATRVTRECTFDEVVDSILKGTHKNISKARAEQIAHSLYSAARLSYSAVDDDSPVYLQVNHLVSQIQEETKLKSKIIEQMTALARELPEYNKLLSIPGLGARTVVSLIGELGDIRRFRNSNALNAFIGIDLRHYESGDYVANDHISKRGNTVARKILFKAIQNIASAAHYHPNHINDYYQRRKMDAGQYGTKKIAIAAIHRLIRTIYHLVINNQFYDYSLATKG